MGPVEGHIHRLKLIKRQMYGRAKLDLLRIRVLHGLDRGCVRTRAVDRSGLPSPKVRKTPNENSEIISNVLSGFAVYMGLTIAVQPPDEDHPYGHGKGEPFAAAAPPLAVLLVVLGADAKRSLIIKTKIVELFIMLARNQPSHEARIGKQNTPLPRKQVPACTAFVPVVCYC